MPKNEGRTRGQIVPKGEGKWLVRVPLPSVIDEEGKLVRKYYSETVKGTFKEAQRALTKKLGESDTQQLVEPSKLTLKVYCGQWLETQAHLATKTKNDYTHRLEKDIYPVLGGIRLDKLTPLQVQQAMAGLTARGLSPRTVQYSYTVLKSALSDAVEMGMLAKTPCRGFKLPRKKKTPPAVWTAEESQQFLAKAIGTPDHILWQTVLSTGLRPEEYLALQWTQVDLEGAKISVTQALNEVGGGNYIVGQTKTDASRRVITIPKELVDALKVHKKNQAAETLKKGPQYKRLGFVFAGRQGNFQDISAVRRRFKTAIAHAEVPVIPLYNMRHTHATLLLTAGVQPKVIQERLGHSSITVTSDTYSHVLPSLQNQTADTLSAVLFNRIAIAQ